MIERIAAGRPVAHVAAEMGVSRKTADKWWRRWIAEGEDGLEDRSSRPHRCPHQTPARVEDRIVRIRQRRKLGPARIQPTTAQHPMHGRSRHTILANERGDTCAQFWNRAMQFFTDHGITVETVLTDNARNYTLSHAFQQALAGIEHRRIRPHRPQTNGKVERFNRTLADEWAYVRVYRSNAARTRALDRWLHLYNHHRGHTALGGEPPITRATNLAGEHS